MSDDVVLRFQHRRPLLQHVAQSLQEAIVDALADEGLPNQSIFAAMTTDEFRCCLNKPNSYVTPLSEVPGQVFGTIDVANTSDAARVKSILDELFTVHAHQWKAREQNALPTLELSCVIPPHAMPEGWSTSADMPELFTLSVRSTESGSQKGSESVEPVLLYTEKGTPFPLVMKGGGVKGLAYVGAVEVLSNRYSFNWYVGTSAGAITAILLAAGFTPDELKSLMKQKDFRDFFDAKWYQKPSNLLLRQGFHRADTFTRWIDELLATKLQSPRRVKLSDLPHRVTVYACRRGQRTLAFDSQSNDADAAYAARCSMSIPYVFTPQAEQGINTYDGGMHQNYPIEQLLKMYPNIPFISLYLGPTTYEPQKQGSVLGDLLSIWTEGADMDALAEYPDRTVIIDPRPIRTLDFDLSDAEKEYLLACGRAAALQHIAEGSEEHLQEVSHRNELKAKVEESRRAKVKAKRRKRFLLLLFTVLFIAVGWMLWKWVL